MRSYNIIPASVAYPRRDRLTTWKLEAANLLVGVALKGLAMDLEGVLGIKERNMLDKRL